jgi:hypothetical protein
MFSQKINSLQDQISELQAKQQQYRSLEQEANAVVASIARLHQAAATLGEEGEIEKLIAQAIGFSVGIPAKEPAPEPQTYEEIVERVTSDFKDECDLSRVFETEPLAEEIIATLIDDEAAEDASESNLEKYLEPQILQQALDGDDPELALMEVASLLDTSHQDDLEERVRYFVQKLPSEMSDRILSYLPKSVALLWVEVREKVEEDARDSLFPPITRGTRVEVKPDGEEGTVSWIGQDNNGEPVASVTVSGGTRGSIPVEELEVKPDVSPNEPLASEDPEVDELARLCLKQKAWSQIRLFADRNPNVIIRMEQIAATKTEKRIINNLPSLILGYIGRANDRSDLAWIPENVLTEVEALLGQPQQQSIA